MSDATPQNRREAIRERVRSSGKEAVVLEEMRRLGFWPKEGSSPEADALNALNEREAALVEELNTINRRLAAVRDPEMALLVMRKERMAAARARREETRRKQAQQRYERAQAWHARQTTDIVYLGEGVSAGLADSRSDPARLAQYQLPSLEGPLALAEAMGVNLAELRFLAYHRSVSRISHYRRFGIAKKTGGVRVISAPMPRLKRAQYWVLDNLLAKVPVHEAACGFVPGRSIVDNAQPHVGQAVVVNLDLQSFFPSIAYPRVYGLFQSLGYSRQIATLLALLCTETPTEEVELDGNRYHVQCAARCLPQGAPSSPAITNLLCRRLDRRLAAAAAKLGFTYTRYADDMTFSAPKAAAEGVTRMLWRAKRIIADEGFTLHPEKQHIMRAGSQQTVTGIVVNQKPALCRDTLRRFRATLFQVEKDGPAGKSWNGNSNVVYALEGYARFIRMVDPAKGAPLCVRTAALRAKWGGAAPVRPQPSARAFREASAKGQQPPGRVWVAAGKAAPQLEKTAQQLQGEREASRAATAGEPPVDLPPRPGPGASNEPPVIPFVQVFFQVVLLVLIAFASHNPFLGYGSIALAGYSLNRRRTSLQAFLVTLIVGVVLQLMFRAGPH